MKTANERLDYLVDSCLAVIDDLRHAITRVRKFPAGGTGVNSSVPALVGPAGVSVTSSCASDGCPSAEPESGEMPAAEGHHDFLARLVETGETPMVADNEFAGAVDADLARWLEQELYKARLEALLARGWVELFRSIIRHR